MFSESLAVTLLGIGLAISIFLVVRSRLETRTYQRLSEQAQKLDALGRAIHSAAPDKGELATVLTEHMPHLFSTGLQVIWLFLEEPLYHSRREFDHELAVISGWLAGRESIKQIEEKAALPWSPEENAKGPTLVVPIRSGADGAVIAGMLIEIDEGKSGSKVFGEPEVRAMTLQSAQSIADYLSSQLGNIAKAQESDELQGIRHELNLAAQIQASFLPTEYPEMPGWQLAVSLEPAGELSGDFFDLIPLSKDRIGILIADVAGKGLGAALYMALCRTLIRTFAAEYATRPDIVFSDCNERVLQDASAALFVTAFYGVLDLAENTLTYANAGHHPPYLFSSDKRRKPRPLFLTGIPIGIDKHESWEQEELDISQGDTLLLYSDGITDAQNDKGELFGNERLLEAAGKQIGNPSGWVQKALLTEIREFVGETPQFDDMTMLVLRREKTGD